MEKTNNLSHMSPEEAFSHLSSPVEEKMEEQSISHVAEVNDITEPKTTVLSANLSMSNSTLKTSDDISIYGKFEKGNIKCRILRIEKSASVSGKVEAKELFIDGVFSGSASASLVRLSRGSNTSGNIKTDDIGVQNGAKMNASISTMGTETIFEDDEVDSENEKFEMEKSATI